MSQDLTPFLTEWMAILPDPRLQGYVKDLKDFYQSGGREAMLSRAEELFNLDHPSMVMAVGFGRMAGLGRKYAQKS